MSICLKIDEIYTSRLAVLSLTIIGYLSVEIFFMKVLVFLDSYGINVRLEREFGKIIVAILFVLIFHEFLHYFVYWRVCGVERNNIYFSFNWKWLVPYCGCQAPVSVGCQRIALICPIILTGCLSLVILFFQPAQWSVVTISFALSISSKDVIDFFKLRIFDKSYIVTGHPTKFGGHLIFKNIDDARNFFIAENINSSLS